MEDLFARHEKGQPVLVGTTSVERSEYLSGLLKKRGIPHEVLNAKNHEREATIVAQAGRKGSVTVATNMAGRGTDIMLGGNPEFLANAALMQKGLDPDVVGANVNLQPGVDNGNYPSSRILSFGLSVGF